MAIELMNLRRDDQCAVCVAPTPASTSAWWDSTRNNVTCTRCRPVDFEPVAADQELLAAAPRVEVGVAGTSTDLIDGRRADSHRRTSGDTDSSALSQHVTAWRPGAKGEEHLDEYLDGAFGGSAVVLHHRKVADGDQRGTIDHIIIASSGVWVVDATHSSGLVDVQTHGAWIFKQSDLYVGRRNQRKLVDGMGWQAAAVKSLLESMGMGLVPVHPALCFVESGWSRQSNAAVIDGVLVLSPDKLRSVASQPGAVQPDAINAIATQLTSGLPAVAPR